MKLYKVKLLTTRNSRTFSMIASCRLSSYIVPSMRLMYGWYHSWNSFTIQRHYTNRLPFPSYNDVTLINGPTSFTPSTTFKYQPFLKFITRYLQCFMELLSELIDSEYWWPVNIWYPMGREATLDHSLLSIVYHSWPGDCCEQLSTPLPQRRVFRCSVDVSTVCICQVIAVCLLSVSALVFNLFRWT